MNWIDKKKSIILFWKKIPHNPIANAKSYVQVISRSIQWALQMKFNFYKQKYPFKKDTHKQQNTFLTTNELMYKIYDTDWKIKCSTH